MARAIKVGSITIQDCEPKKKRPMKRRTAGQNKPIVGGFVIESEAMFLGDGEFVASKNEAKRFLFLTPALEICKGLRASGITSQVRSYL